MAAPSIWRRALPRSANISVSSALCQRVRFKKSQCRKCLDICPDDAISFNPGPTLSSSCSECGLCQTACPTEVFRDDLRSETYLLDQVRSLLPQSSSPGAKRRLFIHCQQAEASPEAALSVSCLGALSENVLVGAALLGFDETVLISGRCSECRLRPGEALVESSIKTSSNLLRGLDLGEASMRREEKQKQREAARDRKELFSLIFRRARDHAASARYQSETTPPASRISELQRRDPVWPSARRETLRRLVAPKGPALDGVLDYDADSPWGILRIEEASCSACGTCAEVCPTGAIRQERGANEHLLYFDSGSCTNCALCSEACPEAAIDFEDRIALAEIFTNRLRVVARVKLTACVLCGESIPAAHGTMCPTCEKRGAWEVHC